jgi:5-oxoprolinase (ATP-hydrolysing) subunit A
MQIDINCDVGEGYPNDALLMPYISSANIACGKHAGDIHTIEHTIRLCKQYHVAIGAHPGFSDKENFGRKEMVLSDNQLYDLIYTQVKLMVDTCAKMQTALHHVKPHGALYNMAATNKKMSGVIASAVKDIGPSLVLYGLSNSYLISEAKAISLQTAAEVFVDRTYTSQGLLSSRSLPYAIITDEEKAIEQALQMVEHNTVTAYDGTVVSVVADTICLHGDNSMAVGFAKSIYQRFIKKKIAIQTASPY